MRERAAVAAWALAAGLVFEGCSEGREGSAGEDEAAGCFECHDRDSLLTGSVLSARDHMSEKGTGFSTGGAGGYYGLSIGGSPPVLWIKRGRHSQAELASCDLCHPRHASFSYPAGALERDSESGADCSGGCHDWLTEVSMLPARLMNSGGSSHTRVWREGYGVTSPEGHVRLSGMQAGCTGCHNVFAKEHGAIPSCTDCHAFAGGGSFHDPHVALIKSQRASADPGRAGVEVCAYCHAGFSLDSLFKASCYGCHLSAHDPRAPYWLP